MTETVLCSGAGLAYDLMAAAGQAAAGLVAGSRARSLAHLRAAELDKAAEEMETSPVLHYMWRLATRTGQLADSPAALPPEDDSNPGGLHAGPRYALGLGAAAWLAAAIIGGWRRRPQPERPVPATLAQV